MSAWFACALCALVLIKPQEFIPLLAGLPLVHVANGAVLLCGVRDVLQRAVRPAFAPHAKLLLAFALWALFTTAVRRPDTVLDQAVTFGIVASVFAAIAIGCASAKGLAAFAKMFLGCALLVSVVAILQSQGPWGCFIGAPDDWEGKGELAFDGRECVSVFDCKKDEPVPDGNYRCEHVGPFGTQSIGGRVRYRGSLADPNELSLMTSIAVPLAFALAATRRRAATSAPAGVARSKPKLPPLVTDAIIHRAAGAIQAIPAWLGAAVVAGAVVLSKSRSGVLVFLVVVGIQAIRRAGAWGVVVGCALGPPLVLLGGRSGTEADSSTDERAELLQEGFEFIRHSKGFGIGVGQFADQSSIGLTAHNAYVLAAAETGVVGLTLFALAMYLGIKVPFAVWFGDYRIGWDVRRFAPAIGTTLVGVAFGAFFLSWTYKDVLMMVLGLSVALYGAARGEDPAFRVRLSWKEAAVVLGSLFVVLAATYVASRIAIHH